MEQAITIYRYLTFIFDDLLVLVEIENGEDFMEYANVVIPHSDLEAGADCYIWGIPNNAIVVDAMMYLKTLEDHLVQSEDALEMHEEVCSLYWYEEGAPNSRAQKGYISFGFRPQDFAVRHLWNEDMPPWKYRRIHWITGDSVEWFGGEFKPKPNTHYVMNAYVDVPMDEYEMIRKFMPSFPLMAVKATPNGLPMKPTDCLGEDDFWDESLGVAPEQCPEWNEDYL